MTLATLHMVCGKVAAGKSTLAKRLSAKPGTLYISEDEWLAVLYGAEMETLADYRRCSARLAEVVGPHVSALLTAGLNVVMDFPANTREQRRALRDIADAAGAPHVLHYLDVTNVECLERLRVRNASGTHPFAVTEAQFHQITAYFEPPTAEEGLTLSRQRA